MFVVQPECNEGRLFWHGIVGEHVLQLFCFFLVWSVGLSLEMCIEEHIVPHVRVCYVCPVLTRIAMAQHFLINLQSQI
jgi:hypothetical protein